VGGQDADHRGPFSGPDSGDGAFQREGILLEQVVQLRLVLDLEDQQGTGVVAIGSAGQEPAVLRQRGQPGTVCGAVLVAGGRGIGSVNVLNNKNSPMDTLSPAAGLRRSGQ
jgi:hypothetical protein